MTEERPAPAYAQEEMPASPLRRRLELVNEAPLTPELMRKLVSVVDTMPEDQGRNPIRGTLKLTRFIAEQFPEQSSFGRAGLLATFLIRMDALDRLRDRPEYKAWALMAAALNGGADSIHEGLISVAATEPLTEEDNQLVFEANSFFQRVLSLAEAAGRG
jgi:hypothetical protein